MSCERLPKVLSMGMNEKSYLPTDGVGDYVVIQANNKKEAVIEAKKRLIKYTKGKYAKWMRK